MNNYKKTIIFIRHADTQKDPSISARDWTLSEKGFEQAQQLTDNPDFLSIQHFFVSSEQKTKLTIHPLADKLGLLDFITTEPDFDELKRGTMFLSKEEFEKEKKLQLENLDYKAVDSESCNEALTRFKLGINRVLSRSEQTVAVVSHGTILNCYFADILDCNNELPKRWLNTPFACYGIIEYQISNDEQQEVKISKLNVIRDIVIKSTE